MKQYELVQVGNQRFRKVCTTFNCHEILTDTTKRTVERMIYTMRKVHGVGLAAPQIGLQKQFFVLRLQPTIYRPDIKTVKPYVVFNPKILSRSGKKEKDWEGCFSVAQAGLFARVDRAYSIKVSYFTNKAEMVTRTLVGLEARVFQHEFDHLYGEIFLDLPHDTTTYMSATEYKAMRKRQFENSKVT